MHLTIGEDDVPLRVQRQTGWKPEGLWKRPARQRAISIATQIERHSHVMQQWIHSLTLSDVRVGLRIPWCQDEHRVHEVDSRGRRTDGTCGTTLQIAAHPGDTAARPLAHHQHQEPHTHGRNQVLQRMTADDAAQRRRSGRPPPRTLSPARRSASRQRCTAHRGAARDRARESSATSSSDPNCTRRYGRRSPTPRSSVQNQ